MNNIKWGDGAVCLARGAQVRVKGGSFSALERLTGGGTWRAELSGPNELIEFDDLQLNEIRQGDYIEASEIDTEQKYNDAVEVFGLFGFAHGEGATSQYDEVEWYGSLTICHDGIFATEITPKWCARKLTYPQLMAIGKLKRAMIDRDSNKVGEPIARITDFYGNSLDVFGVTEENDSRYFCKIMRKGNLEEVEFFKHEWSLSMIEGGDAQKIDHKNTWVSPKCATSNWSDEHYNHFYQLTQDDIKAGQIKVDAYFVNRMWKINSWEDTGAGFHILKTFPRIANNKNSLKRELVALKKQIDMLCKLHGVDDES